MLIMTVYDISYCQPAGIVLQLASAGASGVIIRNGYMCKTDDLFPVHIAAACKSFNDKMIGSYTYCMADTVDDATTEAKNAITRLKPFIKYINMPVYLDMESKKYCDKSKREENTAILLIECDLLQRAGFTPGIYTNESFIRNYIHLDVIREKFPRVSLWLADYRRVPYVPDMPVDIWQTGIHTVNTTQVDINKCFVDFRGRNKFFNK